MGANPNIRLAGSIPAWAGETPPDRPAARSSMVYPRVGGGNPMTAILTNGEEGLSPRGRGKRHGLYAGLSLPRSIPAWAGETLRPYSRKPCAKVYPRVGGGNAYHPTMRIAGPGLSPRGRGKLELPFAVRAVVGSIPAWAGETQTRKATTAIPRVYPRVGGGNKTMTPSQSPEPGLSPRGRGKPPPLHLSREKSGSIPAWAGETLGNLAKPALDAVYPRVGGGNEPHYRLLLGFQGLSPRGRGKRRLTAGRLAGLRSIPAWAGETPGQAVGKP